MMAYPRPIYDPRSPHEPERARSGWDPVQRPHYPSMPSPSHHPMPSPGLFDPESEGSDVSDTGEDHQSRIHSTYPAQLPPPPPKHSLESLETVEGRLRELQRLEDHNIKKLEQLKLKRARKDERIRRKREAQDLKIKAIMDVRERRDHRISRRRKMEDEAFERFDQDLEDEESNLRRVKKRLKRGLPVEENSLGSRISSASMSPPGPIYSNVPPAKRHQTGPPGQNNSPVASVSRPVPHSAPAAPSSTGPNPPPYAFLQSSHPPTSAPYGRSPTISHSPQHNSGGFQPIPRSHQPPSEPSPYALNGHPPSPHTSRPPVPPINPVLNTAPPPRQISSYDTRPPPPPPVSSGFATINTPPSTGFAPINPRNTATPPAPAPVPLAKSSDHDRVNGHGRPYAAEGTPTVSPVVTGSKRTPSSTHPYQQSEAFANRHHHCERVDHLSRGIWTSYGPGGTKEVPTGPPVEMYLRCNHDGCRRIDWRTVHGLQCHIVKNHEQPKGTIGSLEKALDRYGVPVAEVEAYERQYGDGTGGTMADPKNVKLKQKPGQANDRPDGRRSYGAQQNPVVYQSNIVRSMGSATQPYQGSPASVRSLQHEETEDSETEARNLTANHINKGPQPPRGFAAVNNGWSTTPTSHPGEPKDQDMKNNSGSPHLSGAGEPPKHENLGWKGWPEVPGNTKPENVSHPPPPPSAAPILSPIAPPSTPNQQPGGSGESSTNDARTGSTQHMTIQTSQPPNLIPTQPPPVPKLDQPPFKDQKKETQAPIPPPAQSAIQEQAKGSNPATSEDTEMTGTSSQEIPVLQPSAPVQEKRVAEVQESQKEAEKAEKSEKPRTEIVEPPRPEPKSPETTRRPSVVSRGKPGSRRPSMATRAQREREKEPEEVAATKAEAEAEREKERQENEEDGKRMDPEIEADTEKGREQDKEEEDSEDPDTITAVVSSSLSKDKEKDREKDGKENKTTPRRQRNGRFVRNAR